MHLCLTSKLHVLLCSQEYRTPVFQDPQWPLVKQNATRSYQKTQWENGTRCEQTLAKGNISMAYKHMKKYSTPLVVWGDRK